MGGSEAGEARVVLRAASPSAPLRPPTTLVWWPGVPELAPVPRKGAASSQVAGPVEARAGEGLGVQEGEQEQPEHHCSSSAHRPSPPV